MGIINKQMGNLIREMDKLTVDEIWQGKKTLMNLKTGQQKLNKLKHKEEKKSLRK